MVKENRIPELKERLEKLTKLMDVPCFRYTSIKWLQKNIGRTNKNHPSYAEAKALVDELSKLGAH